MDLTQEVLIKIMTKVSEAGGEAKFEGLEYSHRVITNDDERIVQVLDVFDSQNHSVEYHITEGMPKPAEQAIGIWSVKEAEGGKTEVTITFKMVTKPFVNDEMATKIQMGLGMGAKKFAKEFKYYLENNDYHPKKNDE